MNKEKIRRARVKKARAVEYLSGAELLINWGKLLNEPLSTDHPARIYQNSNNPPSMMDGWLQDGRALASDWQTVSKDIRKAFYRYEDSLKKHE